VVALHDQVRADLGADLEVAPVIGEGAIVEGDSWEEALDALGWEEAEVLVVGSGRHGLAHRLFLGGHANKIVRSSPVPVVAAPGGADLEP